MSNQMKLTPDVVTGLCKRIKDILSEYKDTEDERLYYELFGFLHICKTNGWTTNEIPAIKDILDLIVLEGDK